MQTKIPKKTTILKKNCYTNKIKRQKKAKEMTQNIIFITHEDTSLLNNLTEECYILDTSLNDDFCTQFINKATSSDKIVLFYGKNAINKTKYYNANGILIDLGSTPTKDDFLSLRLGIGSTELEGKISIPEEHFLSLKKELGKNSIIGLISRNRRHEAMLNSELEPDFIVFKAWQDGIENTKELLSWYNDFFIIQSAVLLMDKEIDTNTINADFIIKPI